MIASRCCFKELFFEDHFDAHCNLSVNSDPKSSKPLPLVISIHIFWHIHHSLTRFSRWNCTKNRWMKMNITWKIPIIWRLCQLSLCPKSSYFWCDGREMSLKVICSHNDFPLLLCIVPIIVQIAHWNGVKITKIHWMLLCFFRTICVIFRYVLYQSGTLISLFCYFSYRNLRFWLAFFSRANCSEIGET